MLGAVALAVGFVERAPIGEAPVLPERMLADYARNLGRVAEQRPAGLPLSLRPRSWIYFDSLLDFAEAYRRRCAYALAFEASLAARSLAPYLDRRVPLLTAPAAALDSFCPRPEEPHAFSLLLNLRLMLSGAMAHARRTGSAGPDVPGPAIDGDIKLAELEARLTHAARLRAKQLTLDGHTAIEALRVELRLLS